MARHDSGLSPARLVGIEAGHRAAVGPCSVAAWSALDVRMHRLDIGGFPAAIDGPPSEITVSSDTLLLNARGACPVHDGSDVAIGLQYRHARITDFSVIDMLRGEPNPMAPASGLRCRLHDSDIFVQAQLKPTEKLQAVGGARVNVFQTSAENLTSLSDDEAKTPWLIRPMGRLALVWWPATWATVKALYGRALRPPGPTEMFADVPPIAVANIELRPEVQDTLELAFDIDGPRGLALRASTFYNAFRDAIVGHIAKHGRYTNTVDPLATYGTEGRLQYESTRLNLDLSMAAQTCRNNNACDRNPAPGLLGQAIAVWRPFWATDLSLTVRLHAQSGYAAIEPTYDIDASLVWTMNPGVKLLCTGRNLLGRRSHVFYSEELLIGELRRARIVRLSVVAAQM